MAKRKLCPCGSGRRPARCCKYTERIARGLQRPGFGTYPVYADFWKGSSLAPGRIRKWMLSFSKQRLLADLSVINNYIDSAPSALKQAAERRVLGECLASCCRF